METQVHYWRQLNQAHTNVLSKIHFDIILTSTVTPPKLSIPLQVLIYMFKLHHACYMSRTSRLTLINHFKNCR